MPHLSRSSQSPKTKKRKSYASGPRISIGERLQRSEAQQANEKAQLWKKLMAFYEDDFPQLGIDPAQRFRQDPYEGTEVKIQSKNESSFYVDYRQSLPSSALEQALSNKHQIKQEDKGAQISMNEESMDLRNAQFADRDLSLVQNFDINEYQVRKALEGMQVEELLLLEPSMDQLWSM